MSQITYNNWGPSTREINLQIEDLESVDIENIHKLLDNYFETRCPVFEPEIVYGLDKEYFLPALKVLKYKEGKFLSPGFDNEWVNGELQAKCESRYGIRLGYPKYVKKSDGTTELQFDGTYDESRHDAPADECDCGIYGSVNLDEIKEYLGIQYPYNVWTSPQFSVNASYQGFDVEVQAYRKEPVIRNVLCLIEPSPDAKVIMCRKGWKASHAFISEIIGQTITQSEASQLLSIAWKREIDIRRLQYENR